MFHIHPVNPQDFDHLFTIEQAAHLVPWSMGTLKNNQGEHYLNLKIIQAEANRVQIAGFAVCQTVLDEATLFNIAIAPQFQGQGLGKALLTELLERLRRQGILTVWLEVRESNHKAKKLYSSLGFNEVDIRRNYYPLPGGGRENAIVMACYL
ncbi:ribosomal protein S18-alanine N-acetyltransferase [Pasteurellaceae bacterium LIM206]|nr:ribosomal protein S18-alanine N-acetyltransferase [Pasteurellaceae bacterium LIM206]